MLEPAGFHHADGITQNGTVKVAQYAIGDLSSALAVMSLLTYFGVGMSTRDKPLVWLEGEILTPPFSASARIEAGYLLRRLQKGERLSLPHSRPMPSIGAKCHELRIVDDDKVW